MDDFFVIDAKKKEDFFFSTKKTVEPDYSSKISLTKLPQTDREAVLFSQFGIKCLIYVFPPRESKNINKSSVEKAFVDLHLRSVLPEVESVFLNR